MQKYPQSTSKTPSNTHRAVIRRVLPHEPNASRNWQVSKTTHTLFRYRSRCWCRLYRSPKQLSSVGDQLICWLSERTAIRQESDPPKGREPWRELNRHESECEKVREITVTVLLGFRQGSSPGSRECEFTTRKCVNDSTFALYTSQRHLLRYVYSNHYFAQKYDSKCIVT